jgi:predicted ribosome quality control (RQC) complex YloA/Tae2 family protein
VKTPSFLELSTIVEYISDELNGAQLQEVFSTDEGLVLSFYQRARQMMFLVFDLDRPFPFLGVFRQNPWPRQKKTKPCALFLNSHAKNSLFKKAEVVEELGRVVRIFIGENENEVAIEFRLIPKQANLIVRSGKKSISWYPVKELATNDPSFTSPGSDEVRSITAMMNLWLQRRGVTATNAENLPKSSQSPFEKWVRSREKDLEKKKKAMETIKTQMSQYQKEDWAKAGEYLKTHGLKNAKPEFSAYFDFEKKLSANIERCFEKAKAVKRKIAGSEERLQVLQKEVLRLGDVSEEAFQRTLAEAEARKSKAPVRKVEGRLRKTRIPGTEITAYMGKSASDNMDLLRNSKPHDLWLHLKDYPSSHAIIHRQKNQSVSDEDLKSICTWFVQEGLTEKQTQLGGKFSVVVVECRHVKAVKGDKIGRVTYHNAREVLIAL